ncbi:unnamed protein product [Larinioides sclopetarius]|uniref:Uncharacterized protein n=1 Tax=Larinioides sclopetarius TaxID=280406 RepID=A0AAV1ZZU4_9ARAC
MKTLIKTVHLSCNY